jgi:hypothetical protein
MCTLPLVCVVCQDATDVDPEQKISVKERMQKFNRLAETDMKTHPVVNKKKIDRVCGII